MTTQDLTAVAPVLPKTMTHLAREIAINQREVEDILSEFKISMATYEKLKENERFAKLVDAMRVEWNSAVNTPERVRVEAAYLIEEIMPKIYGRMTDTNEPLHHVVAAGQWLSKVAGLEKPTSQDDKSDRFQITINLGNDKLEFDKSKKPVIELLPTPEQNAIL